MSEPASDLPHILDKTSPTRVLAISSGKGGVGKSTIAVNLAIALSRLPLRVGILDADIYGSSLMNLIDLDGHTVSSEQDGITPPTAFGIKCIAMSMFVEDTQPVVWRGPMLHGVLQQFLTDVDWGQLDILVIDMPPGTGDILLSLAELIPRTEVLLVTTPKPDSQAVASRAAAASQKLKLVLRGVIENMSYFTGQDGVKYLLFGEGGGDQLAKTYSMPLLAKIPLLDPAISNNLGKTPLMATSTVCESTDIYNSLAKIIQGQRQPKIYRHELKIK
jgi:ATP-binding protein involved in chromosome partitioning